jgi:hypothetical protein
MREVRVAVDVRMRQLGWRLAAQAQKRLGSRRARAVTAVLHRNKFTKPAQKVNKTYILYKTKVFETAKLR